MRTITTLIKKIFRAIIGLAVLIFFTAFVFAVIDGYAPSNIGSDTENASSNTSINEVTLGSARFKISLDQYSKSAKPDRDSLVTEIMKAEKIASGLMPLFIECMGDFAVTKDQNLLFDEVFAWCFAERNNDYPLFRSHFNQLDAKDLSLESSSVCQKLINDQLSSPPTADHPWLDRTIYDQGRWNYIVRSYVDSQNGFGSTIRTNYRCNIQYIGTGDALSIGNWRLHELSFQ